MPNTHYRHHLHASCSVCHPINHASHSAAHLIAMQHALCAVHLLESCRAQFIMHHACPLQHESYAICHMSRINFDPASCTMQHTSCNLPQSSRYHTENLRHREKHAPYCTPDVLKCHTTRICYHKRGIMHGASRLDPPFASRNALHAIQTSHSHRLLCRNASYSIQHEL